MVSMLWFVLDQIGQRTCVKCAEAMLNYKVRGIVHLKSPAFFLGRGGAGFDIAGVV